MGAKRVWLILCRYLIADYERSTFSISQCNWDGSLVQNIIAIPPLPRLEAKRPSRFSAAAIAGIAIGTIVCLGILLFLSTRKLSSLKIFSDRSSQKVTELGTSDKTLVELSGPSVMQELDGKKYLGPELDGVEHMGYEMDGLQDWIPELPAREEVASEIPV